ncbi:S-adenosyl-L-methionine-dependent methyltransferase [Aspergillus varians]
MDDIVSRIQTLASEADLAGRARIQSALRSALSGLESPQDTLIQLYNGHLRNAVVRLGISSGLFRSLSQSQDPLSVAQLAKQSGASPQLFERLLRYLASNNIIEEVGQGQFKGNKTTHVLADEKAEILASHSFDFTSRVVQAFPDFIVESGFADVTDVAKTPFQKAFNTDLPCFTWLSQHPEHVESLQQVMKTFQSGEWIVGFGQFEKEALETEHNPERVFFVDVGGGSGHQCVGVSDKYPGLQGRLVVQDLPEVVKHLSEIPGVRIEANDIFQEQNIKGAKFYYLRRIFHDWPDAQCVQILRNLRSAMASDSRILINEVILPETSVPWQSAMADLAVMILLGGRERTRTQWATLAEQSGLQIAHIHEYNDFVTFHSVLVLEIDKVQL